MYFRPLQLDFPFLGPVFLLTGVSWSVKENTYCIIPTTLFHEWFVDTYSLFA